jgi:hypothetical protein
MRPRARQMNDKVFGYEVSKKIGGGGKGTDDKDAKRQWGKFPSLRKSIQLLALKLHLV